MLSYFVMKYERIAYPQDHDGWLYHFRMPRQMMARTHRHRELELNLALTGRARTLTDGVRHDLFPGGVAWFFRGQDHMLLDCSHDFSMQVIIFRPQMVRRLKLTSDYATLMESKPDGILCRRISDTWFRRLSTDMADLEHLQETGDFPAFNATLGHILTCSWRAYCQGTSEPGSVELHPAVERAVAMIDRQPQVESLEIIAEHAGLSPARLSRLFTQQVGVPLITFRNTTRVRRFMEIYGRGHRRTILQAALDAGFGSYPQFHRVFRQVMGISPAQYRRSGGSTPPPTIVR